MLSRPSRSTRLYTLFPYTTPFRTQPQYRSRLYPPSLWPPSGPCLAAGAGGVGRGVAAEIGGAGGRATDGGAAVWRCAPDAAGNRLWGGGASEIGRAHV